MPSTKNVNNQGNEHNSLCLASFTVFPHFDVKCVLDSFFSFPGDLSNQLLLQRIDNGDIKRSIFAIGPEGEQDISKAVKSAPRVVKMVLNIQCYGPKIGIFGPFGPMADQKRCKQDD